MSNVSVYATIIIKNGLAVNLPSSGVPGEPFFTTDTNALYIWNGSSMVSVGGGTVNSIGLTDSTGLFTITGSPVTTSGTLNISALASQTENTFLAAPNGSNGAPTFRTIAVADVPTLNQNTTGSAGSVAAANVTAGTMQSGMVLVAPALGTPVSGTLTNCTFPTFNQNTTGSAGSVLFSGVGAATNTHALVIGTGGSLGVSGSGTITATGLTGTPNISVGTITASGLITGQANIQLGVAGTTSGVVTLEGSSSGAATITAPAVAGTTTNPIAFSNSVNLSGTTSNYQVNGLAVAAPVLISPGSSSVTNTSLTSNVATYTCANSFVAGQLVSVTGCSAPYNVVLKPIVAASSTQFTVAITNANVGSAGASGAAYVPVEDTRGGTTVTTATPSFVISDNVGNPLVYVAEPFSAGAPTGSTTLTVATYVTGSGSVLNFVTPGGGGVAQVMQNGIAYLALGYGSGLALINAGGVSIETSIAGQNSHNFLTGNNQATFDMAQFTGTARTAPGSGVGRLEWQAGTDSGTLKLVAYSGTSTTGTVIADNTGTDLGVTTPALSVTGLLTNYNGISTVGNGIPSIYAQTNLTAQAANIGFTSMYSVPSSGAGIYRIHVYLVVTRAATSSSTLPDSRITYTDQDSGAVITVPVTTMSTGNALTTFSTATIDINAKASTNIQYDVGQVNAYASTGATSMQFAYRNRLEYLG